MSSARPITKSTNIIAVRANVPTAKQRDAAFRSLLQRKCLRAASIGALTSIADIVPGVSRLLGLLFGELLDVKLLTQVQRELVEETLTLYNVTLSDAVHRSLVKRAQWAGGSASTAADAIGRRALARLTQRLGSGMAKRLAPFAAALSSALSNAAITYAIGKRAQLTARSKNASIISMPDTLRALSGLDERRILAWSLQAVKDLVKPLRHVIGRRPFRSIQSKAGRA